MIACSGGGGSSAAAPAAPVPGTPPAAVGLVVSPTVTDIKAGDTLALTATVSGTTDTSVTWSVDGVPNGNANVGTISGSGTSAVYTAPDSAGSHVLTATSQADASKKASSSVTVHPITPAVSVTLSPGATTLTAGASQSFSAVVSNAADTTVKWTVDGVVNGNGTVGTVTGSGNTVLYTAPAVAGSHTLVATSIADSSKKAASTISVQALPLVVSVTMNPTSVTLNAGGSSSFTAAVSGTTNTAILWSVDGVPSGNASTGTVAGSGLTITYTAPTLGGSHTLTATSVADASKSASAIVVVQVPPPAETVTLNPVSSSLAAGSSTSFMVTVSGVSNTAVTWAVDGIANGNSTVGTLTGTGNTITYTAPAAAGSHTLVATSQADATKSASALITVQAPPAAVVVSLSPATGTIATGASLTCAATVSGTTNTGLSWAVDGITDGNASVGTLTGTGTTRLYTAPGTAGTHSITATSAQDPSQSATATVTVVVPIGITSVAVSPASASLNTGAQNQFTASVSGTGSYNTSVTWSAQRGTISGSGLYTAPATGGSDVVTATSVADASKSSSASITVTTTATISSVTLSPAAISLTTGAQNQFVATVSGTGSYSSAVTWTAQRGSITSTGLYTAPATSGSDVVTATSVANTSKSASASITVASASSITSVTLSPTTISLNTSAQNQFIATVAGTGSYSSAVTWTAQRGSITSAGLYTAPATSGSDVVTATSVGDSSKSASSSITVNVAASITSVTVSPTSASLNTGTQKQFTATVAGTGSYSSAVTWTAQRGTVTSSGLYTAPATSGSDVVTATSTADASKSASSSISVAVSASITSVAVSPATLSLNVGAQNQFIATVAGTGSYSSTVTWSAQRGTITSSGLYTAPATSGSDVVTATSTADATKSGAASVTVAVTGVTSVAVSPATLTLLAGAQNQFVSTVTGTGSYSSSVTWTAQRGTITSGGLYTAPATGGSDVVTATSVTDASKSASATITVTAAASITSVTLSPTSLSLNTGAQNQFVVTVSGTGNYSSAVTWTAQRGTITSGGLYTAPATSGSDVVTATSVADTSKSSSSTLTVTAATSITSVAVSPTSLSLNASAQNQFVVTVSGTGSYSSAVTWTAQRGTITSGGLYTAPATSGSDVVTATSVADTSKSASSTLTISATSSITSVTVSPTTLSLTASAQNQFTVAVSGSGSYSSSVTWSAQRGSITSGGLYTAPASGGSDVVTATSTTDSTKSSSCTVTVQAAPAGIFVAPNGLSTNPGTLASPTTLEGARTLLQNASRATAGTLSVYLRGGIYPRTSSFTLGSADSGSAANPIQYVAYPNETPRIIGGVSVNPASAHLVDGTDPNWSRLDPSARSQIYVVDLSAYSASLGTLTSRADGSGGVNQSMEVFVDGKPLTLARYPKAVDVNAAVTAPQASIHVSGTLSPDVTGDYAYKGLDSRGRPYYQLAKNGDVWSIAASATGPDWRLSNRRDLGGTGTSASWGTWDTFAAPAGAFVAGSGASGTAFLSPADGSNAIPGFLLIRSTNGSTQITAPDPNMSQWRASEAMYFGLGYYSWSGSHSAITSFDPTTGSIVLANSVTYGLRAGQPFFIYNLLEELTAPGECFIDRVNARLYLRPVGDVPPSEILLSTLQAPVLQMSGCQQITWNGISFEAAKDRLVYASSCQNVAFRNCQFRNAGGYAMLLNGSSNLVEGCDFRQLGKGGIWASGGNRTTLTPSGTLIENSEFQYFGRLFWTYQPAINLGTFSDAYNNDCMGFTIQHNEIHHSPHAAILFSGNGNTIKYNHIHDATQWTNDAGVIYTTGREWGTQGNLIQFNLIRNCGSPLGVYTSGIYIDGVGSGVKIEGNILYKVSPMFAIQHNGGRDVQTQYNIFSGHWYGVDI
ncbi:right-handed parallel beta-helix repeat-containing protein, partial [Geothrix limicola]|uniref:right-handed parallel beta-helix repeat-containing protein n=1 Tax=Geothrix limicola TaxID=2927978 RepID=UPI002554E1C1